MDRVCYILGAGFSAPLGLPVMSNFFMKSKDMFFAHPEKYGHFQKVFDEVKKMSVSKNYYETDLFNIEEILSILEMQTFLERRRSQRIFTRYIQDVIEYYTPSIIRRYNVSEGKLLEDKLLDRKLSEDWRDFIFGQDEKWRGYKAFIGNIINLIIEGSLTKDGYGMEIPKFVATRQGSPSARYAIVTFNYDRVAEKVCDYITRNYKVEETLQFETATYVADWSRPNLSKLHGSVESKVLVPPTWNKGLHKEVSSIWKNAYRLLVDANYIRFVGYSLPTSDSYVKYLLKSAVLKAEHLKKIDVICLDPDGSVRKRYDDFITFKYYRFVNADIDDYLKDNYSTLSCSENANILEFNQLETRHERFMSAHA